MIINKANLVALNETEAVSISGGESGTLADEIGYVLGSIWGCIVTAHSARARGQIIAHSQ